MKICIKYQGRVIADNILLAESFFDRLVGLMFRSSPPHQSQGLLIDPCNSIHTFFMRYALDVVFLNSENKVVKIIRDLRPWRITWLYWRAVKTLELRAGQFPTEIKEGDFLEVTNV